MDTVTNTTDQSANPVKQLLAHGQSPWLDFIRRSFLAEGSLKKLVDEDGLGGVTSNPSIFEKAMGSGADYDTQFKELAAGGVHDANELYEDMAVDDIRHAADILRPVYDRTRGLDGFVSLEVSPYLALRTEETIAEARRLWKWVDRPNLMVKVPGTEQGAPSVRTLIEDGLNINVTLLFALSAYQAVAEAYLAGLEARLAKGLKLSGISSVASFFVSRIDAQIDKTIDQRIKDGDPESEALKKLRGRVAIANAKQAYAWYQEMKQSDRWKKLEEAGANPQRLLWASTGTKDKAYSDVLYVEELIGRDTVNTMPPATMDAFRDHGVAADTLTQESGRSPAYPGGNRTLRPRSGIGVTKHLVEDGVKLFADAADNLLGAVAQKRTALMGSTISGVKSKLPPDLETARSKARWIPGAVTASVRRLWARDASLWTGDDEAKWLAWLGIVDERTEHIQELLDFQKDVQQAGFAHVLLLGMGGSSLGPEVLGRTFGHRAGWPTLHVLDSTDPQQIKTFRKRRSIWPKPWSSSAANPAARWSRTSSKPISSTP